MPRSWRNPLQLGFGFLDALLLLAHFVAHGVDGVLDFAALGEQAAIPVDVGDFVGDFGGGALRILADGADVHQRRVAVLFHPQAARQDLQGQLRRDGRLVFVEFGAPDLLEIQVPDDFSQDRPGLHDLLLGHQEEGIVAHAVRLALVERIHVHRVFADLELGGGGELSSASSACRPCRHDGQQRDGEDDFLAIADDAPIVEEMEGGGLGFFCHGNFRPEMSSGARAPARTACRSEQGKGGRSPVAFPVRSD
jgi:hypothetical protein